MSKDIRSYFTVTTKKPTSQPVPSKKRVVISSDEELPETKKPTPKKRKVVSVSSESDEGRKSAKSSKKSSKSNKDEKKKKTVIISDSEDDTFDKSKEKLKVKTPSKQKIKNKEKLTPKSAIDFFGSASIKQKPSVNEIDAKRDKNLEATLKQLDEENEDKKPEKSSKNDTNGKKKDDFDETLLELDNDDIDMDLLEETVVKQLQNNTDSSEQGFTRKNKKLDLNESGMETDQEKHERKRHGSAMYQQYLNRSGPANLGKKEMPKGKADCLRSLCFLKTGVLDSLDSDMLNDLVKSHGGRTVSAISRKVNYVIVGSQPGPAKLQKAESFGIKQISEDELLDLILKKSGMEPKYVKLDENDDDFVDNTVIKSEKVDKQSNGNKSTIVKTDLEKIENSNGKKKKSEDSDDFVSPKKQKIATESTKIKQEKAEKGETAKKAEKPEKSDNSKTSSKEKKSSKQELPEITKISPKKTPESKKVSKSSDDIPEFTKLSEKPSKSSKSSKSNKHSHEKPSTSSIITQHSKITSEKSLETFEKKPNVISNENKAFSERYKPESIKNIIGQQDGNSNMNKLHTWLRDWFKYHSGKNRPKLTQPSPWDKSHNGSYYKCALLSGSPGIGKTTTATLVAKDLGFDVVEYNASDTRSKRLLHEEILKQLKSQSLASYVKGNSSAPTKRHVLLMDEVDGMSGNEDRGGMQELIALIKESSIPIICMCNDRNHQKIKSLGNYCFDLRFAKPKLQQIKGAMRSICAKEQITISNDALDNIITGAGLDIRQILNHLSMWAAVEKSSEKGNYNIAEKDVSFGPWDVIRKLLSTPEYNELNFNERARLFYHDYSIGPLFMQENYLSTTQSKNQINNIVNAADSISIGDIFENKIRSTNSWSLLESQAMFSSAIPSFYMHGTIRKQINFPSWLGKNSKATKFKRMIGELRSHTRSVMTGSRSALNQDYITPLKNALYQPLVKEDVEGALTIMNAYNLLREDFDNILELSQWPKKKSDAPVVISTKVKSAFTRNYNKSNHMLPFAVTSTVTKKKGTAISNSEDYEESNDNNDEDEKEEEEDITKSAMIKVKTRTNSTKEKTTKSSKTTKSPKKKK